MVRLLKTGREHRDRPVAVGSRNGLHGERPAVEVGLPIAHPGAADEHGGGETGREKRREAAQHRMTSVLHRSDQPIRWSS